MEFEKTSEIRSINYMKKVKLRGRTWKVGLEEDEIFVRKIMMDLKNRVKSNHRVRGGIVCMDG